MHAVLRFAFHLARLKRVGLTDVAVVLDPEVDFDVHDLVDVLTPWSRWMTLRRVAPPPAAIADAPTTAHAALGVISDDDEVVAQVSSVAHAAGVHFVPCTYPPASDLEGALFHEVAHHHYELGGFNEWNDEPGQYSSPVLQLLSARQCRRHFPHYALPALYSRRGPDMGAIDAVDVGCGPISGLRWGALHERMNITGIDPLLDVYAVLRRYHGFDGMASIASLYEFAIGAEELCPTLGPGSADLVYCRNALDHVRSPSRVIGHIATILRRRGVAALEFATREGSRQDWQQLHQFDLELDDQRQELVCTTRAGKATPLLAQAGLAVHEVVSATDAYSIVVLAPALGVRRSKPRTWMARLLGTSPSQPPPSGASPA